MKTTRLKMLEIVKLRKDGNAADHLGLPRFCFNLPRLAISRDGDEEPKARRRGRRRYITFIPTGACPHRIRQLESQTIGKAITDRRLEEATRLIKTPSLPLLRIAAECGFCDAMHLTHRFTAKFNLSPRDIRKR